MCYFYPIRAEIDFDLERGSFEMLSPMICKFYGFFMTDSLYNYESFKPVFVWCHTEFDLLVE